MKTLLKFVITIACTVPALAMDKQIIPITTTQQAQTMETATPAAHPTSNTSACAATLSCVCLPCGLTADLVTGAFGYPLYAALYCLTCCNEQECNPRTKSDQLCLPYTKRLLKNMQK